MAIVTQQFNLMHLLTIWRAMTACKALSPCPACSHVIRKLRQMAGWLHRTRGESKFWLFHLFCLPLPRSVVKTGSTKFYYLLNFLSNCDLDKKVRAIHIRIGACLSAALPYLMWGCRRPERNLGGLRFFYASILLGDWVCNRCWIIRL